MRVSYLLTIWLIDQKSPNAIYWITRFIKSSLSTVGLTQIFINSSIADMKTPVVQEDDYGCAVACVAFVLDISYGRALKLFSQGKSRVQVGGDFYVREIAAILNSQGLCYKQRYIKSHKKKHIVREGTIILTARNKRYATGHYLVRHNGRWMDSWINLAKYPRAAGYRLRLPGRPQMGVFDETTGIEW